MHGSQIRAVHFFLRGPRESTVRADSIWPRARAVEQTERVLCGRHIG
jgi:hypothetical protein